MLRVVIPGGTGVVGTILARHFHQQGHRVTLLGRYPRPRDWTTVHWEPPAPGPWMDELEEADVVINLAGGSLNQRQSARHRREIVNSRLQTTAVLGAAIARCCRPPGIWINLGSLPAGKFGAEATTAWEEQFLRIATPGTSKAILRAGWVMSTEPGGAFPWLLRLIRFGLVGRFGAGQQSVAWIHERDFVEAVDFVLRQWSDLLSPVDLCSPDSVSNAEMMTALRLAWDPLKLGFPLPGILLQAASLGWLLESDNSFPSGLLSAGFNFTFPAWTAAAADLVAQLRRKNAPSSIG